MFLLPMFERKDLSLLEKVSSFGLDHVISFTNIGNCDSFMQKSDEKGMFVIKEHYFSIPVLPGGLTLSTATISKQMCFTFAYDPNWISKEFVIKLSENVAIFIEAVCTYK